MTNGVELNDHAGEQYGIYIINGVSSNKTRRGVRLYSGTCTECGFEKFGTIGDFKKNVQTCKHIGKLTQEQFSAWYEKNKKRCLYCGEYIPFNTKFPSEYKEKQFCDQRCSCLYMNERKSKSEKYCMNCGCRISSSGKKFCSQRCQQDFQYKAYIERWKQGLEDGIKSEYQTSKYIRRYLFEKYDSRCCCCGWGELNQFTGKIPLEVHHKDGDYTNNEESNLELLCPNCHSLTKTYKAANMGNGRKGRKKYT